MILVKVPPYTIQNLLFKIEDDLKENKKCIAIFPRSFNRRKRNTYNVFIDGHSICINGGKFTAYKELICSLDRLKGKQKKLIYHKLFQCLDKADSLEYLDDNCKVKLYEGENRISFFWEATNKI